MADIPDCGGPWVQDTGGGDGDEGSLPPAVVDQLIVFGEKGVVVSGMITWMEAQMETHGSIIWLSLAERCFQDKEVNQAKEALKAAKGTLLETLVPDFKKNRSGVNKKTAEIY